MTLIISDIIKCLLNKSFTLSGDPAVPNKWTLTRYDFEIFLFSIKGKTDFYAFDFKTETMVYFYNITKDFFLNWIKKNLILEKLNLFEFFYDNFIILKNER